MPSPDRVAPTLSRLYHANSRISIPRPIPITTNALRVAGASFQNFPGRPRVVRESTRAPRDLDRLLERRTSTERFHGSLPLSALLDILQRSTRVNRASENREAGSVSAQRVYPSAGGLYPLELYVIPLDVPELKPSVYHWDVLEEALEELWPVGALDLARVLPGLQPVEDRPAAIVAMSAIFARVEWKYGERGYRFCLVESGALGQTMQLVCVDAGIASRWLGGFVDSAWDELLRINGDDEATLMLFGIG